MQVLYADGDVESVFLPMERVRLTVSPGEILVAPMPDELTATAQHLLLAADAGDDEAKSGTASLIVEELQSLSSRRLCLVICPHIHTLLDFDCSPEYFGQDHPR